MAKVPFTKLALSKNNNIKILEWKDQKIEIKQYLPIEEKLNLITKILNLSIDENLFYNPCRVDLFQLLEIIFAYTNINITEKQSEDIFKIYDLLFSSGLADAIKQEIPKSEIDYITNAILSTINEVYRYRDSVMGVMDQINADQKLTENSINDMIDTLKNSEELHTLQEVSTKLG